MNALEALHTRTSCPRLIEPAPNANELKNIYLAATRAADHGLLRPWRFLTIEEESLDKLGELFAKAALEKDPSLIATKLDNIRRKPRRAPLIIVCIATLHEHPKIPTIEMELSAAAATQNMLIAAHAQNIGGMWRTGAMAYSSTVKNGLGLGANETIVGFLYLGTRAAPPRPIARIAVNDLVQRW
ncbi:MAG: nitroreductase family protein [Pseudohongiellaceae bacterium]